MTSANYESVRKLKGDDACDGFDCGQPALNQFLQRFALTNQRTNSSQTYVCCQAGVVAGYYSLAVGSVEPTGAAPRVVKGMPQHPVPVMILARLAVDLGHQRVGMGRALLKDALKRTAQAADIAGIRALLVQAMDEQAATKSIASPISNLIAPHAFEVARIADVQAEIFGPVLQVVRWDTGVTSNPEDVIAQINALGYGLTLGTQTHIDSRAQALAAAAHVGNIYINRNMIGAVVGVPPFWGEGLSGTGPKAGGPHYLYRF